MQLGIHSRTLWGDGGWSGWGQKQWRWWDVIKLGDFKNKLGRIWGEVWEKEIKDEELEKWRCQLMRWGQLRWSKFQGWARESELADDWFGLLFRHSGRGAVQSEEYIWELWASWWCYMKSPRSVDGWRGTGPGTQRWGRWDSGQGD